jgi:hypothetical protein
VKIKTTPFTENELKEKHDILLKKYENESKNYFTESKKEKNDIIEYFSFTDELHNKAYNFNDQKINILFKNGEVKEIYNASDQLDKNFLSKEIKKYYYFEI